MHVRVFLSRYRGYALCPECKGARLRKEALYVRVNGKNLADIVRMNIAEAQEFFQSLELSPEETAIAEKILVEIRQRLKFLNDVGLEYLTLDRLANTLSGGEAQRIQLATSLGSRLVGACYVLDEPSIGLHSRDTGTPDPHSGGTARIGQHDRGGGARSRRDARRRPHRGPGSGRGRARRRDRLRRRAARADGRREPLADFALPAPRTEGLRAAHAPRRRSAPRDALFRSARAQPQEHRGRDPAGHDGGGDRRLRVGQIDAGPRRDFPLAGSAAQGPRRRGGQAGRGRRSGDGRRARPAVDVPQGGGRGADHHHGDDRSIAHRAHAALQPGDVHQGVRPDSRLVRRHARIREARLYGGPLLVQRSGRPLRSVPGRRHGDGGDAVPGRCGTDLRRVQGHALQERHPGDSLQQSATSTRCCNSRCARRWISSTRRPAWCSA